MVCALAKHNSQGQRAGHRKKAAKIEGHEEAAASEAGEGKAARAPGGTTRGEAKAAGAGKIVVQGAAVKSQCPRTQVSMPGG